MVLQPLEFSDCYLDSPEFRENLRCHEHELELTNKAIKDLIRECKALISAARNLSKAQRSFSDTLLNFNFESIGQSQTDDEIDISQSLKEFGRLIGRVEDVRDSVLENAKDQLILPLEVFRKEQIGGAKDGKKQFDRETDRFCKSLDNHIALSTRKKDWQLQEADAALDMERRNFHRASLQYVLLLQEVQERKKFEFVETLLGFMYSWLTFYHSGYEVSEEFKPYMKELQQKIQKTRENFESTHNEAEVLMHKMMEKPQERKSTTCMEGYLYALEKRAIGSVWVKYYCQYIRGSKAFIMRGFTQALSKVTTTDTLTVTSCTRRMTDSIEKRFCFDITVRERPNVITLQAISENERNLWMEAMGGKEPVYYNAQISKSDDSLLNDVGFNFIRKCIEAIESRGIEDQGLYRVVGVGSKVQKLTSLCLDKRKGISVNLSNSGEYEIKTITSALKNYFRNLPEPLMTFKLHYKFTTAAKKESKTLRFNDVHKLVHQLPESNFEMLAILMKHLHKVSEHHDKNKMTVSNLGVCFGPTLMRPEEESMAAIMDIKFSNIVVEILIANYEKIFKSTPDEKDVTFLNKPAMNQTSSPRSHTGSLPSQPSSTFQDTPTDFRKPAKSLPTSESPRHKEGTGPLQSESLLNEIDCQLQERGLFVKGPMAQPTNKGRPKPMYGEGRTSNQPPLATTDETETQDLQQVKAKSPAGIPSSGSGGGGGTPNSATNSNTSIGGGGGGSPGVPGNNPPSTLSNTESRYPHPRSNTNPIALRANVANRNRRGRCVRTLYACEAENESELSFNPNQVIFNVHSSKEPGWLLGTTESGKTGLIPENYVQDFVASESAFTPPDTTLRENNCQGPKGTKI